MKEGHTYKIRVTEAAMCSRCAYRGYNSIRGEDPNKYRFEKALCHDYVLCRDGSLCRYCSREATIARQTEKDRRAKKKGLGDYAEDAAAGAFYLLVEPFLPE